LTARERDAEQLSPEVFHLCELADVKSRGDQANETFHKIIDISSKENSPSEMTRENIVLQKMHDLLPIVPASFHLEKVSSEINKREASAAARGKGQQLPDVRAK
jgi:hypothetical protein